MEWVTSTVLTWAVDPPLFIIVSSNFIKALTVPHSQIFPYTSIYFKTFCYLWILVYPQVVHTYICLEIKTVPNWSVDCLLIIWMKFQGSSDYCLLIMYLEIRQWTLWGNCYLSGDKQFRQFPAMISFTCVVKPFI